MFIFLLQMVGGEDFFLLCSDMNVLLSFTNNSTLYIDDNVIILQKYVFVNFVAHRRIFFGISILSIFFEVPLYLNTTLYHIETQC